MISLNEEAAVRERRKEKILQAFKAILDSIPDENIFVSVNLVSPGARNFTMVSLGPTFAEMDSEIENDVARFLTAALAGTAIEGLKQQLADGVNSALDKLNKGKG